MVARAAVVNDDIGYDISDISLVGAGQKTKVNPEI